MTTLRAVTKANESLISELRDYGWRCYPWHPDFTWRQHCSWRRRRMCSSPPATMRPTPWRWSPTGVFEETNASWKDHWVPWDFRLWWGVPRVPGNRANWIRHHRGESGYVKEFIENEGLANNQGVRVWCCSFHDQRVDQRTEMIVAAPGHSCS